MIESEKSMDTYKYNPIDLDRPAVRLLRLLRGSSEDTIECDLFQGWINRASSGMPYDALSYTWGSTERTHMIQVGGKVVYVTSNLHCALRHLRLEDEDRILWIDAICIDQNNLKERNHQVQHISQLYKEAGHVVVWLGEGDEATDLVMDAMRRLEERLIEVSGDWRRSAHLWIQPWLDVRPTESGEDIQQPHSLIRGMESILNRPWFRRIWILQEIAHARAATIICGEKSISARIFSQVPSLIGLNPDPHCQAILDIMPGFSRKESWWNQDRSLHNLLWKFGRSEATDERDIIYALLGISSDASDDQFLRPDYSKSLGQVIHDTIVYLITPSNHHRCLVGPLDWTMDDFLQQLDSLVTPVLRTAIRNGPNSTVSILRAINEIPTASKDTTGLTSLQLAVGNGQRLDIKSLLEWGAPTARDASINTPLCRAIENGHRELADLLMKSGTEVGWTPLPYAVEDGQKEVVKFLLENVYKTDLTKHVSEAPIPFNTKCKNNDAAVLPFNRFQRATGPKTISEDLAEPLLSAVKLGHVEISDLLITSGADVNFTYAYGRNALSYASQFGYVEVVKLFLARGADINLQDDIRRTPLSYAAELGKEQSVRLLLKQGANVNLPCSYGRTPIMYASVEGHTETAELIRRSSGLHGKMSRLWRGRHDIPSRIPQLIRLEGMGQPSEKEQP